ncbi:SnaRE domain-containing protein [Cardiosporidium cionae]|uniref:SnaRE domain-containing protein n=1 Tax=Cardiosporidium cionae TaxID=476202 RepID=A0ABQ7JGN9_9APIC|nr:SnaRE domain-containing protein [Cardiosporidium cionae]|eukprot:KAF8823065.1 SnaRE domain-containing protein [Cardiosporidium cionae]
MYRLYRSLLVPTSNSLELRNVMVNFRTVWVNSELIRRHNTDESHFEISIKNNIRRIRSNLLSIEENLKNLNRDCVSRRIAEALDSRLKETYSIIAETHQFFREWVIFFAGNPIEKRKRKFSHRKLRSNFHSELKRVQQLSNSVEEAAKRVARNRSGIPCKEESLMRSNEDTNSSPSRNNLRWEDTNTFLKNSSPDGDDYPNEISNNLYQEDILQVTELDDVTEHETLIQRKIAEERLTGLNRIRGQVLQVHQAFRDLAGLVSQQDSELETIETYLDSSYTQSANAVTELEKSYHALKRKRHRRMTLLLLMLFALSGILWFSKLRSFLFGSGADSSSPSSS